MSLTTVELPYGHRTLRAQVPGASLQAILVPKESEQPADEATLLQAALANPIGTTRLCEMAQPGQKVFIVTSDLTRLCPSRRLLPASPLLT